MRKALLICISVLMVLGLKAQDPHFSQTYTNLLYLSPSFTGTSKEYRVSMNYRNQWPKLTNKLTTTAASFDYNLSEFNSGVGVTVMRDVIGSTYYTNTTVGISYSYNIMLNRKLFFRPGLSVRYGQNSIDFSKLNFSSDLEIRPGFLPDFIYEGDRVHTIDGGVSGLLLHNRFWTGITVDHLFTPDISFTSVESKIPVKYTVFGGYKFHKAQRLISRVKQETSIAATYRHQGVHDQLDVGFYTQYDMMIFGVWYRNLPFIKQYSRQDAIVFVLGFEYETLRIGYSYDFSISNLITSTNGAHELSLVYEFEVNKRKKYKALPCPKL